MMCPINVNLILDAVEKDETFWGYTSQWVDKNIENIENGQSRRRGFIKFLTSTYTEGIQDSEVIAKVREAIDAKVTTMNANFDCVVVDEIFVNPGDCAKYKTKQ